MTTPWLLIAGKGDPHDATQQVYTAAHMTRDEALQHYTELAAIGRVTWCEIWVVSDGERTFELRIPEETDETTTNEGA